MFRRKEENLFDSLESADAGASFESAKVIAPAPSIATAFSSPSFSAPRPAPGAEPKAAPAPFRSPAPAASPMRSATEQRPQPAAISTTDKSSRSNTRVLTVGPEILMKGEINGCDRLLIEGRVEATLRDVNTVEITEGGSFKGTAEVQDAEISGMFEGDLTVRGRLVVHASGKVRGKVIYGEVEIQRGGELTGEIKTTASANDSPRLPARKEKEEKVAA